MFNRLHCSQGTKGNTSIHTSFIAFLRSFHTTRKCEGLMWEGKPKKSQDVERTHSMREAQKVKCWARHKPDLPAASQTFFSSKSWAHTNCVSNINTTSKNPLCGISQDSERKRKRENAYTNKCSADVEN